MSAREWLRRPGHLLVAFLVVTLLPACALGVLGWQLFQQDVALAAAAVGAMAGIEGQERPDLQLKAAVYKETVEGDLRGAIALYKQIISNASVPRPIAAAALLGLGGCYEKLEQAEARNVYERLIAEYSEQTREVAQARARLAEMARTARMPSREPRFRKVSMAARLVYTDARLSPDGKEMAFSDRGAVWVVPLASRANPNATGIPTKLTGPLDAFGVTWSPDGRSIAFNTPTGISLVARSGGAPKELARDGSD